jgi:hypothetical protein
MTLNRFVVRAADLVGAYGNFNTSPSQVDAETLAMGSCAQIRQVMELFIKFVYRKTADGLYINITGNGSIPAGVYVPWAHKGKPKGSRGSRAQLTETERNVVREWLKMLAANRRYPLFVYRSASRRWYVDVIRYSDEADGLAWLSKSMIEPKAYVSIKLRLAQ